MSNSIDQDETAHYEPSHLDLSCLLSLLLSPVAVKELRININALWAASCEYVLSGGILTD